MKKIHVLGIVIVSFLVFESFSSPVALGAHTITFTEVETSNNSLNQPSLYVVTSDYAVMFDGPDNTSKKISKLKKGITVELLKKKEDWYKVKYKDLVGFVKKVHLYDTSAEIKVSKDFDYDEENREK